MKFLFVVIYTCFASTGFAAPFSSIVGREDVQSSGSSINTTIDIRDHDGKDVTANFKIMVYDESKAISIDRTKLHERSMMTRPMNECTNSTFLTSYCTPQHNIPSSLQRYSIICSQNHHYLDSHRRIVGSNSLPVMRSGRCRHNEVCVNRLGPISALVQGQQMATCVDKSMFDETMYGGGSETMRDIQTVLEGPAKGAYMVMSDLDGADPIEADTFDVMSWIDAIIEEDGNITEKKCRDCTNLEADSFADNTKALKVQATMLTAGAMAGILWLSVLSG